jgi:hypothetical protein
MSDQSGFTRNLTAEQMKELLDAGGKMAASMRAVLALSSERMDRLREVNTALRASGAELTGEERVAVTASLQAVSASLKALQASLRITETEVIETTGKIGSADDAGVRGKKPG